MTVLDVGGGGLLVHSPVEPTAGLLDFLNDLGRVHAIVAPNLWHSRFLSVFADRFPSAQVWGPAGLEPNLSDGRSLLALDDSTPVAAPEIDQITFTGHALRETALLHRSSNTLVIADLAYNVTARFGLLEKLFYRTQGAFDRSALSRAHRSAIRNKAQVRDALERVLEWPFDRIVMSHGEVRETGGHAEFRRIWCWLLGSDA